MSILIKGGEVVNHDSIGKQDVLIVDGKIAAVGENIDAPKDAKVIDASGKFVMPGGIDSHVHLELPFMGTVSVDDYYVGSRAALSGGTTCYIDFIIPKIGQKMTEAYKDWLERASKKSCCDFAFHCGVVEYNDVVKEEMAKMAELGVTSFKMFMAYKGVFMLNDEQLYKAMTRCKEIGCLPQVHAENGDMVEAGQKAVFDAGVWGPEGHLLSRQEWVEAEASYRIIKLAHQINVPIYIVHVMSKSVAQAISEARNEGKVVIGEPIAAGLSVDGSKVFDPDWTTAAGYVMSPPLRDDPTTPKVLMEHLASGALTCTGTDNCTFTKAQKAMGKEDFRKIPNGVNGIEDRMRLIWEKGVNSGLLSPQDYVRATSTGTAQVFNMYPQKGYIGVGSDADIIILDPEKEKVISAKTHHHGHDFNIYEGMKCKGDIDVTISRGKVVYDKGEFLVEKGAGKYVPRKAFNPYLYSKIQQRDKTMHNPAFRKVERKMYEGEVMVPAKDSLEVLPDGKTYVKKNVK